MADGIRYMRISGIRHAPHRNPAYLVLSNKTDQEEVELVLGASPQPLFGTKHDSHMMKQLRIHAPVDYDLLASVHAWIFPDVQPVPEMTNGNSTWRMFTIADGQVPIRITQFARGEKLGLEWDNAGIPKQVIAEKVTRVLSLDQDMAAVHADMQKNQEICHLVDRIRGIRPYLADTAFEALIKTIIQQQISYRAANVITRRLILGLGAKKDWCGTTYSFPSPEAFASLGMDGLKQHGLGYKAAYIDNLCGLIIRGDIVIDDFKGMSYEEVTEVLQPIKGIGEWTVRVFAIAGLGDFSVFPFGDLGIQNLLGRLFNLGRRMKKSEVEKVSARWGKTGPMILYLLMCADVLGYLGEIGRSGNP
jgi:3-methyladenine DNA glycosylase/8-oxoguanine DNA glycosylase